MLLVMFVGMLAFAIDVGYIAHARTQLQSTADSGGLAGLAHLYTVSIVDQEFDAARDEVKKYVGGAAANQPGLVVLDDDIQFGFFDPDGVPGKRFTTDLKGRRANAARVTLRQDGVTNPRLKLFFGGILGRAENDVETRATTWVPAGLGILPGAELIPYTAQVDFFNAAAGLPARPVESNGFRAVDGSTFEDKWNIGLPGSLPTPGADGMKELVLFGSTKTAPGNFGSVDLGTASNGTPELARQIRYGPSQIDFTLMGFQGKLAKDGSLQAPVTLTGDPGISNGTKDDWDAVIGQNKIIPLYETVNGNGNNADYRIVAFAGVRVVAADMRGNPKRVWVQPTEFYSTKVTGVLSGTTGGMHGVKAAPKLVIP